MDKIIKPVRKAVFPVAGLGTRFLPATKASPKEMLPIVDKPLIQYAAEEAVAAGIEQLIFVTSSGKRTIADHFDRNQELENELEQRGKYDLLAMARHIVPEGVSCIYVRQPQALGLGHAVLCARPVVGDEPFAVILADDLIDGHEVPSLVQMVNIFEKQQCSVLAVEQVPQEETYKYGIVASHPLYEGVTRVTDIVEKPSPDKAPSRLAVVGRYLLTPRIFDFLEKTKRGAGGEIQLTDAIAGLLSEEQVLTYQFKGTRYDCGSKLGYLMANIDYALKHPNLREDFRLHLLEITKHL
ncbi:UTP--glucose-1-phosphate uridylyltransferase GalU [Thioflexithrix psekupsensis]|uniref:UTP--glucose-1-phosphate uridylyltransferase n=1 Tax=Thioflexithrix psekupsensis TaxID=1570016 RepID=A0A251X9N8_9GAMM|nr:UTP--glucose-1-phosphate uridylyltransferase GalU [Thioflexithrix psekupsensis]OUD14514.1 UTP--glucose-1-phosphate uridylyltransferase [Thioflexithrix psekupsensis]